MTVTIHTFLATESLQCLEWANVPVKALEPEIQELKPWFSHLHFRPPDKQVREPGAEALVLSLACRVA